MEFKSELLKAIRRYNRYRFPESEAELLTICVDGFTVKFSGGFCSSCGLYDYFEDLLYAMSKRLRSNLFIEHVKGDCGDYIVSYRFKGSGWVRG
ncbi:MAG: hypothetical protein QXO32_01940 [Candidatus Bathyarchaeia archaeon]